MTSKLQQAISTGTLKRKHELDSPQRRAGSLVGQVAELAIGEVASRIVQIDETLTLAEVREALPEMRHELRNRIGNVAQRAKENSKRDYRVTVFDSCVDGQWFVIAIIRRTA